MYSRKYKKDTADKLKCARRNIMENEFGKVDKSWMMKASIRNFYFILSMLGKP